VFAALRKFQSFQREFSAVVGVVTNNCFGGILLFYAAVCRLAKIPVLLAGNPSGWVDNVRHLCAIVVLVGDNTNKGGREGYFCVMQLFAALRKFQSFKRELQAAGLIM
jgi:hypothetical protein